MSLEEPRRIKITFKYIYPYDIPDKEKFYKASDTLRDAADFLGIKNFKDYKIFCCGIEMWPYDLFGFFTNTDELTIIIQKKHLVRTKLIRRKVERNLRFE